VGVSKGEGELTTGRIICTWAEFGLIELIRGIAGVVWVRGGERIQLRRRPR
jgi:hypothetical protein